MEQAYETIAAPAQDEFVEKRSRFIGQIAPVTSQEEAAAFLAKQGIAVRAGLHCAPFAHERAGTLESGTVRVSFGHDASDAQTDAFLRVVSKLPRV